MGLQENIKYKTQVLRGIVNTTHKYDSNVLVHKTSANSEEDAEHGIASGGTERSRKINGLCERKNLQ